MALRGSRIENFYELWCLETLNSLVKNEFQFKISKLLNSLYRLRFLYVPWKVLYIFGIFDESDSTPRIPTLQKNHELKPTSYDYIDGDIPEFIYKFEVNLSSLITSKPKLESVTTDLEGVTAKPESATTKLESVTIKDDHENENINDLSKVFKLLVVKVS